MLVTTENSNKKNIIKPPHLNFRKGSNLKVPLWHKRSPVLSCRISTSQGCSLQGNRHLGEVAARPLCCWLLAKLAEISCHKVASAVTFVFIGYELIRPWATPLLNTALQRNIVLYLLHLLQNMCAGFLLANRVANLVTCILLIAISHDFLFLILDAIIKKESMTFAKRALKISPPVPRRMGGKSADDDSSVFYLKFKSDSDRNEVCSMQPCSLWNRWIVTIFGDPGLEFCEVRLVESYE